MLTERQCTCSDRSYGWPYVSKGDLFCLLPTLFHPLMKMNLSSDEMNLSSDQMNLSSDQMNLSSDHIIIFLLCGGGDHMTTVTTFSLPTMLLLRKALTDFEMEGQSEWVTMVGHMFQKVIFFVYYRLFFIP